MHRNIKWTQALLRGLLKIAVNDTHIIANHRNLSSTLLETELAIIKHLTDTTSWKNFENRPTYKQKTTGWGHFPEKIEKKKCVQCKKNNKLSNTAYQCAVCKVALHPECMGPYHQ